MFVAADEPRRRGSLIMLTRFAFFLLVTGFLSPQLLAAKEARPVVVSSLTAQSGGQRILIDKYSAKVDATTPAVLVLHGAGGTVFDGPEMRRVARQLAEDGNAVYLIHYFNRTGTVFGLDSNMHTHFEAWLATVRDCIRFVQQDRGGPGPVGIYGYSLGGFLSLAAASNNPAVGAVVEHAGGIWDGKSERIGRMPPVLIVHGEGDNRVPFQKYARPLVAVLRGRGAIVETRFFPAEGHVFSAAAMSEVRPAAVDFFRKHLRKN